MSFVSVISMSVPGAGCAGRHASTLVGDATGETVVSLVQSACGFMLTAARLCTTVASASATPSGERDSITHRPSPTESNRNRPLESATLCRPN